MVVGRVGKNLSHLIRIFPADVKHSNSLPSCLVSALIFFCSLLSAYVVYLFQLCGLGFVYVCVWYCYLKLSPRVVLKYSLMFLSARRLWMDSMEKIHIVDNFLQIWVVAWLVIEINVNEPAVYKKTIFKQKHTRNKIMYWLVAENAVNRSLYDSNPLFPLEAMVQCLQIQWLLPPYRRELLWMKRVDCLS